MFLIDTYAYDSAKFLVNYGVEERKLGSETEKSSGSIRKKASFGLYS